MIDGDGGVPRRCGEAHRVESNAGSPGTGNSRAGPSGIRLVHACVLMVLPTVIPSLPLGASWNRGTRGPARETRSAAPAWPGSRVALPTRQEAPSASEGITAVVSADSNWLQRPGWRRTSHSRRPGRPAHDQAATARMAPHLAQPPARMAGSRSGCNGQDGVAAVKRRARDSNPQPISRHLISSQTASRSLTLRGRF